MTSRLFALVLLAVTASRVAAADPSSDLAPPVPCVPVAPVAPAAPRIDPDDDTRLLRLSITTSLESWIAGIYGAAVSYAITDHVALRAHGNLYRDGTGLGGTIENGSEVGLAIPIFLNRTYRGWFLAPGVVVRDWTDHCDTCASPITGDTGTTAKSITVGPELVVGYQWVLHTHYTVEGAIGLTTATQTQDVNTDSQVAGTHLLVAGYFRAGIVL